MSVTRRKFVTGTAAVAGAYVGPHNIRFSHAAPGQAPDVSMEELMQPGPLADRFLGPADAAVTIVEYAAMTCTHCAQFAISTFPDLRKKYIETGKVRYTIREFPIDQYSAVGAMLARSAGERYFEVIDTLLKEQRQWVNAYVQPLMSLAIEEFGFTVETFRACLADRELLAKILANFERGGKLGVSSVPTLFVNGHKYVGFLSSSDLDLVLAPYLKA